LPPGTGPRHLAARGELLYIVGELDHQLHTARWDRESGTAELLTQQPVTLAPHRTGENVFDAHVELVERSGGDVLLVSVRGADVISVFDVAPEGELRYRAGFDAGHWPRHFTVTADAGGTLRVVVGAARGHEIRAYALADVLALAPEAENGAIADLPHTAAHVLSPACICPA
jgi:6-phosphogluconolactonase (cycloisomerase 2 family)